jgi:predicted DCC family thiol-disulfide oxidoreductase YuxK
MATPRLVYDDECGFCMWCVRWLLRVGEFEPVGFADLTPDQKARLPDEYEDCMHLLTDDAVYSCGEGAERSLARCGRVGAALAWALRRIPFWARIRERGYRFVADRRSIWGRVFSCPNVE